MGRSTREEELQSHRRARLRLAWWSAGIVVAIVIFIILAKAVSNEPSSGGTADSSPAPAALVAQLSSLPQSLFTTVGIGSAQPLPKPAKAAALTAGGKPEIVYMGAEYCPYCATERWPVVIALQRFGSFKNLQSTHSSTTDVYPNTQTFSFHGATYTSQYLTLSAVEMQGNQLVDGSYNTLDTPTSAENALLTTYDAPPYSSSKGGIPFIDFGGKYIISGATYSPQVLQGQTADQIATALTDPTSDISKGAIGSANAITAAICEMTGNQPGSICSTATIQAIEKQINAQ